MRPSDFLVLISIGVAVITMSEANNKKIWRYKFTRCTLLLMTIWLIWILYLIYYPSFVSRGLYFTLFECEKGLLSKTWAFVLSIVFLIYTMYKIAFQKTFPKTRHDALITYYRSLMFSDINTLLSYLEYYHNPNSLPHLVKIVIMLKRKKSTEKTLLNRIRKEIVYDYYFIESVVSISPSLFLEHTTSLVSSHDDDTITANEYFAKCLIKKFNYRFYEAISFAYKKCNDEGKCKMMDIVEDNPILKYLFYDRKYFTHVQLLHTFKDEALTEITNHNSIIYQVRNEDSYKAYYRSVLMHYLMLYIITIEDIIDTFNESKGKSSKDTFAGVESILQLNPSHLLSHLLYDGNKTDTFYNYLQEEIEGMIFNLVSYCEEHNCPDGMKYALPLWLQLFHPGVEIGSTNEDLERIWGLILDGSNRWPNCFLSIWSYIYLINNKQNKQLK